MRAHAQILETQIKDSQLEGFNVGKACKFSDGHLVLQSELLTITLKRKEGESLWKVTIKDKKLTQSRRNSVGTD